MKSNVEKSDAEIKRDVLSELEYEPSIKVTNIGVLVKDGVVTLNGYATSYSEKWEAVRAVKRVAGVTAIADDIEIKLLDSLCRTDGDIAAEVANRFNWSPTTPAGAVTVTVREGWVTLEGQLEWAYQKVTAEEAVRYLAGVKGVTNLIKIAPILKPDEVESAIGTAFERNALLDAAKIEVETSGNTVILRGKARNHAEREEAERIAWAAPGVSWVDNQIAVEWSLDLDR